MMKAKDPDHLPASRHISRILLALLLAFAGIAHLTVARIAFRAQVPDWVPLDPDLVVMLSGFVEILLGFGLVFFPYHRRVAGCVTALYFLAIFPGNLQQYLDGDPTFGLTTDGLRLARLFLHPVLVVWPLWATGIWPKPKK